MFITHCPVWFPWLLLYARWVTSSPQTTNDSQAIGDCLLLSKQYFFSMAQNPSLNLADTVPATTVSSASPRETFSSFLLSLLWHLSGLILLKICRTSWDMIPSYFIFPFLCKEDFYPMVDPQLSQDSSIPWQRFFQKHSPLWVHFDTYFACAITAVSTQII